MNAVGSESSPGWSIRRPMPFTSLENSFSSFTLPSPSGSSSTVVPVFHSTSSFRTFPAPIVSPSFPSSSSALSAYPSPLGRERIVHLPAGSLDSRNPLTLHQNPLSPLPFSFSSGPPPSTYPSQDSVKEKFFIEPSRLMSGTVRYRIHMFCFDKAHSSCIHVYMYFFFTMPPILFFSPLSFVSLCAGYQSRCC